MLSTSLPLDLTKIYLIPWGINILFQECKYVYEYRICLYDLELISNSVAEIFLWNLF